ncbi:MAG: hypothetical protein ACPGYL_13825, partial [Rhodospirillaceae bacterium]
MAQTQYPPESGPIIAPGIAPGSGVPVEPTAPGHGGFFIGWSNDLPPGLTWWLSGAACVLVLVFGWVAFAVSATFDDPGAGRFVWGQQQNLIGVLRAEPYPVLHVPASEETGEPARAVLLSGPGKRGVQGRAAPLDGQVVAVTGVLLERGAIDMIQVGGKIGLKAISEVAEDQLPEGHGAMLAAAQAIQEADGPGHGFADLGTWRVQGEICDGKCYQGAMRPGTGLAHKACANLCLAGGAPPVLVTTTAVQGHTYFLMGALDGGPLSMDQLAHLTAVPVALEAKVELRLPIDGQRRFR